MRTNQASNQEYHPERAVWLARVAATPTTASDAANHDRRREAHVAARLHGAVVVGEYLYSGPQDEFLSDAAWRELLDFLRSTDAAVLVALQPNVIAHAFSDFCRRTETLERTEVRLVFPQGMGLVLDDELSERSAA